MDEDDKFSFAVSVGEGTLYAYGQTDMVAPLLDEDDFEQYKDVFTLILGPADETGK